MKAGEVLAAMAAARSHTKMRGGRRRVVIRMGSAEIAEVDALRRTFPNASRAALVRALILIAVTIVKEGLGGAPEGGPT